MVAHTWGIKTYSHAHGDYKANSRSNDLTVTGVLVAICGCIVSKRHAPSDCEYLRSALEAHNRKRNEVAHVDETRVVEILRVVSLA
jgi:hypothetical protein